MDNKKNRVVKRDGLSFLLNYDGIVDRRVIRSNLTWEKEQLAFFFSEASKRQSNIFLDVGAYFGYYSLIAAKTGLFDKIHAVEPITENYDRLCWHVKKNGYEALVSCHNVAASDASGIEKFIVDLSTSRVASDKSTHCNEEVQCDKMDSIFNNYQGQSLAVKMDVEGHELRTLKGAKSLFEKNNVFLQVEVHPQNTESIDYLHHQGFRMIRHINGDFYFERPMQTA